MTLLHLCAMLFAVVLIVCADLQATAWMRGAKQTLNKKTMQLLHWLTWGALLALVVSGIILLIPRTYLLAEPLFVLKLLFVGMLLVNAVLIGRLMPMALERPYASLTAKEKLPLFVSGAVSAGSWVAVLAIAYYLFWPWIR